MKRYCVRHYNPAVYFHEEPVSEYGLSLMTWLLWSARISLPIQGRIKSVRTLLQPRKLQARTGVGGRVQIVLPRMDEYEVIVIETEN